MSAPKVGDRVRVTYEGVVTGNFDDWLRVRVTSPAGEQMSAPVFPDTFAVEVLEPAPPAWWPLRDGDVVRTLDDQMVRSVWDGRARYSMTPMSTSSRALEDIAPGDVHLLFRDGKPYVDGAE